MQKNLFNLEGQVAIVTGASRGLGKAMAKGLAEAGASVVIADILDSSEAVEEFKKAGHRALGVKVDVSNKADVDKMVKRSLEEFGQIDILVNNAGILKGGKTEELSKDAWDQVVAVNLTGPFLCSQAAGKQMLKRGKGSIINIASVAGVSGSAGNMPYGVSKAGLIMMTMTIAVEWGHKLRVNSISPGVFATDMTDDFLKDEEFMNNLKKNVPLGRHATADELIGTVVYLASDASSYVNGHNLVIDGGWTVKLP